MKLIVLLWLLYWHAIDSLYIHYLCHARCRNSGQRLFKNLMCTKNVKRTVNLLTCWILKASPQKKQSLLGGSLMQQRNFTFATQVSTGWYVNAIPHLWGSSIQYAPPPCLHKPVLSFFLSLSPPLNLIPIKFRPSYILLFAVGADANLCSGGVYIVTRYGTSIRNARVWEQPVRVYS